MDHMKRKILAVYILFGIGTTLMFIPTIIGSLTLIAAILAAWILRLGKDKDSLIYQHMIYISRSFWMWSFIITLTTAIAGMCIITVADNSIYDRVINDTMNGIMYSEDMILEALIAYIKANMSLMIIAGVFCAIPTFGYIGHRVYHGISYLMKDKSLPNYKSWF